jgi:transcription factor C subunit 7
MELDETGRCYCGKVTFHAKGTPVFNVLCHCRPCSRARGVGPMHLLGFREEDFEFLSGADLVKVVESPPELVTKSYESPRPMTHAFCTDCGCFVYQRPKGASFRALAPTTFHLETPSPPGDEGYSCGVSCQLPARLHPTCHVNYENRQMDCHDALPKWRTFAHRKVALSSDGKVLPEAKAAGEKGGSRAPSSRTVVYLIRHGARHDYANPALWKATCARLGHEASDPPLSALGVKQAREVAEALKDEPIEAILSSPYLRVLQTAQPLAHALGLPLHVENGLAELHHKPSAIPPPGIRVGQGFPEVEDEHIPMLPSGAFVLDPENGKESELEYLRRMIYVAKELPRAYAGKTVACFSHAASVALVGALTGCPSLTGAGTFAPCGIFKLVSDDGGATWAAELTGEDNSAHISSNGNGSTISWGWKHLKAPDGQHDAQWREALALGPRVVNTGGARSVDSDIPPAKKARATRMNEPV